MKKLFEKLLQNLKREVIKEVKKSTRQKTGGKHHTQSKRKYQSQNNQKYTKKQGAMNQVDRFKEIEEVTLGRLIDGDTAWFKFSNKQEYKARFLFIDTPESTKTVEKYGKEATNFVRKQLTSADKIEVEFDQKRYDHYDRLLVWIWITKGNKRELLQEVIAANGYVEKFYDYGHYKYEDRVRKSLNDKFNIFEQQNFDRHTKKNYK